MCIEVTKEKSNKMMKNVIFSDDEILSLRYYVGIHQDYKCPNATKRLYEVKSPYNTLNCLMYDGIFNEAQRIAEGKRLDIVLLDEVREIRKIYQNLFSMAYRSVNANEKLTVHRTERKYTIDYISKVGATISYTSTSRNNIAGNAFKKKTGLVLVDFELSEGIPYIDVNKILGNNIRYAKQKEILLPPFLAVKAEEVELSHEELKYRDINEQPPVGKYKIIPKGIVLNDVITKDRMLICQDELYDKKNISMVKQIMQKLIQKQHITENEKQVYISWKSNFREIIKYDMHERIEGV